jgi:antitoxin component of MazEF toxin-antitoxin module
MTNNGANSISWEIRKMTAKSIAVQITREGMIPLPVELLEELRLEPSQTVYLKTEKDALVVQPVSRHELADRILDLMRESLQGVTWTEIEAGRADHADRS